MHIPVLLCGFICGGPWGLAVGLITPLLNSVIFMMPGLYPDAVAMAFELAAYGLLAGLFYRALPRKVGYLYVSLILAMLGGRIVWGAVSYVLYGFGATAFTWQAFLSGAVLMVWLGIVIQVVLVPALMIALRKTKIMQEVTQNGNKGAAA
jgi:O-antigen ligase